MKRTALSLAALGGLLLATSSAQAVYTAIGHNLINGTADTFYNSTTGVFNVHSTNSNLLTLTEDTGIILGGVVSNAVVDLTTTFNSILTSPTRALFTGGTMSLTFNFDPDGVGPAPVGSYGISGPIDAMAITVTSTGPTTGRLDGDARWTATTVNLPGSGVWPAMTFSAIDSLTLEFGQNLAGWLFNTNLTGRAETQYSLYPTDPGNIPEPATMGLLAIGAAALLRRRS